MLPYPGVPWEETTCLWQVEGENDTQKLPRMQRPGGPAAKLQPSPEGLGINPEDDLSAVGAALNLSFPTKPSGHRFENG